MASLLEIDRAIFNRLQQGLCNTRVLNFPDDFAALGKPVTAQTLYVGIKDERYDNPQTFNPRAPMIQKGRLTYELLLKKKDLRNHESTLPIVSEIDYLLQKFAPDPDFPTEFFHRMSGGFTGLDQGIWGYVMVFSMPRTTVVS